MCEKRNDRGTYHFYADTSTTTLSPGKYRVIGTLSHFKKFTEAYKCPMNSAMNPENKCTLF
ncbi:Peptidase M13 [Mactra antiquata]